MYFQVLKFFLVNLQSFLKKSPSPDVSVTGNDGMGIHVTDEIIDSIKSEEHMSTNLCDTANVYEDRISQTFAVIDSTFETLDICLLKKWTPYLLGEIHDWTDKDHSHCTTFRTFKCCLQVLRDKLKRYEYGQRKSISFEARIYECDSLSKTAIDESDINCNLETKVSSHQPVVHTTCSSNPSNTDIKDLINADFNVQKKLLSDILKAKGNHTKAAEQISKPDNRLTSISGIWEVKSTDGLSSCLNDYHGDPKSISVRANASTTTLQSCTSTKGLESSSCSTALTVQLENNSILASNEEVAEDNLSDLTRGIKNSSKGNSSSSTTSGVTSDDLCDVVVVLAPSAEMAAQVNGVDAGRSWPLVSSPQLNLYAYDVDLQTWRCVDRLPDFPLPGAMLEKHAWRIAWHDNHLFMFRWGGFA